MFIKAVLRVNIGYNTTRQILRNPACIRRRSTSASAALHQDEDPNWVKSQLESVDCVKGFTIPEIIRQNMGGWGKLTAFVRELIENQHFKFQYNMKLSFRKAMKLDENTAMTKSSKMLKALQQH